MEKTTDANERANNLLSDIQLSEQPDTDDIEQRLRKKSAIATNQLERNLGRLSESSGGSDNDEVATRLALRRAKM